MMEHYGVVISLYFELMEWLDLIIYCCVVLGVVFFDLALWCCSCSDFCCGFSLFVQIFSFVCFSSAFLCCRGGFVVVPYHCFLFGNRGVHERPLGGYHIGAIPNGAGGMVRMC